VTKEKETGEGKSAPLIVGSGRSRKKEDPSDNRGKGGTIFSPVANARARPHLRAFLDRWVKEKKERVANV